MRKVSLDIASHRIKLPLLYLNSCSLAFMGILFVMLLPTRLLADQNQAKHVPPLGINYLAPIKLAQLLVGYQNTDRPDCCVDEADER